MNKMNIWRKIVVALSFCSATISAFHIERFLALGNPNMLSISTAVTYELANISIILVFANIKTANKFFAWTTFMILISMQIIGNVFYSFNYIYKELIVNTQYMDNYMKAMKIFNEDITLDMSVFWLSVILGAPIPLVTLLLTKLTGDSDSKKKDSVDTPSITEEIIQESLETKKEVKAENIVEEVKEETTDTIQENHTSSNSSNLQEEINKSEEHGVIVKV